MDVLFYDIQTEISASIRTPILGLDCMDPIRADETKQAVHAKLPYFFSQSVYWCWMITKSWMLLCVCKKTKRKFICSIDLWFL